MKITAAEALLRTIEAEGVQVLFGYPGAANLPIYDKLRKTGLRCVLTRNEQSAAHAASVGFRLSGRAGVCLATSGPGATNLLTGIANAYMDSVPLVAITGQVARAQVGTDAFQEVDVTGVTAPVTKQNYLVSDAEALPAIVREAFYIAESGRPGPVVIDIPLDVQQQKIEFSLPDAISPRGYSPMQSVCKEQIRALAKLIRQAAHPLFLAGGGILSAGASEAFSRLVGQCAVPTAATLMGLTALSDDSPSFLGLCGLHGTEAANDALREADLVVFFGARVSDRTISDPAALAARAKIAQIDIDPAEINKNIPCDLAVIGNLAEALPMLAEALGDYRANAVRAERDSVSASETDFVNPSYLFERLAALTGGDAILTTEVGQNQLWAAKQFRFRHPNSLLTSGGFGTMGYGLPAAIGAKIYRPNETVIAIEGDGSLQMALPELATMRETGAAVKIILLQNRTLGLVREYQKQICKGRVASVDLGVYPHWDGIAQAYGIPYRAISSDFEAEDALREMLAAKGAYLLAVRVDPNAVT